MKRKSRYSGSVMLMALVALGMASVVLGAAGMMVAGDARRTRPAAVDAQLRELLLAGAQISQFRLQSSWSVDQSVTVNLPPALKDQNATLVLEPIGPESATDRAVYIEATLGRHAMGERVHFIQRSEHWQIDDAILNPTE
jgi:hypothetical protein